MSTGCTRVPRARRRTGRAGSGDAPGSDRSNTSHQEHHDGKGPDPASHEGGDRHEGRRSSHTRRTDRSAIESSRHRTRSHRNRSRRFKNARRSCRCHGRPPAESSAATPGSKAEFRVFIFFLQLRETLHGGRIYVFTILVLLTWAIWCLKAQLSRRYRPWTDPHDDDRVGRRPRRRRARRAVPRGPRPDHRAEPAPGDRRHQRAAEREAREGLRRVPGRRVDVDRDPRQAQRDQRGAAQVHRRGRRPRRQRHDLDAGHARRADEAVRGRARSAASPPTSGSSTTTATSSPAGRTGWRTSGSSTRCPR